MDPVCEYFELALQSGDFLRHLRCLTLISDEPGRVLDRISPDPSETVGFRSACSTFNFIVVSKFRVRSAGSLTTESRNRRLPCSSLGISILMTAIFSTKRKYESFTDSPYFTAQRRAREFPFSNLRDKDWEAKR
jgi:hypothetical protein